MKIVTVVTFLLLILLSCQKEAFNFEGLRFWKSKVSDSSGNFITYSFEYLSTGFDIKVMKSAGNGPGILFADIRYRGNVIEIEPVPLISDAVETSALIRFVIDSSGKPLKRVEYNYQEFKEPLNIPQKDYKTDSALFEYNSAGLLVRVKGLYRDSTWFNPGPVQTYTTYGRYETNYSNSIGIVYQAGRIANEQIRVVNGNQIFYSKKTIEENCTFDYTSSN